MALSRANQPRNTPSAAGRFAGKLLLVRANRFGPQLAMTVFAGIDGGGTRTRLVLVGADGTLLSFVEGGSCSYVEQGLEAARDRLTSLWRMAWEKAGFSARPA